MHALATVLLIAGLLPAAEPARGSGKTLVGAWHVTHLEQGGKKEPIGSGLAIVLVFGPTGAVHQTSILGTRRRTVPGTYVVKGAEVHVTMDGKVDRLRWIIAGDRLTLAKLGTSEVVYLVRGPVPR